MAYVFQWPTLFIRALNEERVPSKLVSHDAALLLPLLAIYVLMLEELCLMVGETSDFLMRKFM